MIPQCGGGALGGSSPLTRGKRGVRQATGETVRLIPAHAGKTAWRATAANPASAHPRSRGENTRDGESVREVAGSSPLTRGKPVTNSKAQLTRGLIPAHAGKTWCGGGEGACGGAHPRSRGENASGLKICMTSRGSSPLTRGKLSNGLRSPSRPRLIPAHAGKTRGSVISRASTPAHPRSRGENAVFGLAFGLFPGSSPLTRGKPADLF